MPLESNTQIRKKRPSFHRKSYQKIQPSFFSEHVVPSSVKKEAWSSILKLHAPCVTPFYMWKNRPVFSHGRHNHDHFAVFRSKPETRKALYWSLAFNSLVLTSNWNLTVHKLLTSSCIFLGSSYYRACRQQSNFLKGVIALLSTKRLAKAANRELMYDLVRLPNGHLPMILHSCVFFFPFNFYWTISCQSLKSVK